jgi:hypothetical protein
MSANLATKTDLRDFERRLKIWTGSLGAVSPHCCWRHCICGRHTHELATRSVRQRCADRLPTIAGRSRICCCRRRLPTVARLRL